MQRIAYPVDRGFAFQRACEFIATPPFAANGVFITAVSINEAVGRVNDSFSLHCVSKEINRFIQVCLRRLLGGRQPPMLRLYTRIYFTTFLMDRMRGDFLTKQEIVQRLAPVPWSPRNTIAGLTILHGLAKRRFFKTTTPLDVNVHQLPDKEGGRSFDLSLEVPRGSGIFYFTCSSHRDLHRLVSIVAAIESREGAIVLFKMFADQKPLSSTEGAPLGYSAALILPRSIFSRFAESFSPIYWCADLGSKAFHLSIEAFYAPLIFTPRS
jgi:hypothetical protein